MQQLPSTLVLVELAMEDEMQQPQSTCVPVELEEGKQQPGDEPPEDSMQHPPSPGVFVECLVRDTDRY
jgi:hypothetical protein